MEKDFYITLIYKELEGSITSAERQQLDDWTLDPVNNALKSQITAVWNFSGDYSENVTVDLDKDFVQVQSKIENQIDERPASKSINWMSIAAGVAILIAVIFGIERFNTPSSELVSHTASISNQYFMLEDGSEIYLKKGSSISYQQPLAKDRRVINLIGEGVFHVAHDKKWPLDVKTATETITVLGTKFHIRSDKNTSSIQLLEGQIEISNLEGETISRLKPGESLIRDLQSSSNRVVQGITDNAFSWQSKRLVFRSSEIDNVIRDLEEYYNVSIEVENEAYKKCLLTAIFQDKNIDQVMNVIAEIHGVIVQKTNNKIRWQGGKCD